MVFPFTLERIDCAHRQPTERGMNAAEDDQSLIDALPCGAVAVARGADGALRVTRANPAARAILGAALAEGAEAAAALPPALAAALAELCDGAPGETRTLALAGADGPARATARKPGAAPRAVVAIVPAAEDPACAAAARAETLLAAALEATPAPLTLYDAEDRLIAANPAGASGAPEGVMARIIGMSFEDGLRATVAAGMWPEAEADPEGWIAARVADHRARRGRPAQRTRDGRVLRIVETPTRDGGCAVLALDVTAETEARTRAERAEARLRAAIDAMPNHIAIYDPDDRLVTFNRHAATLSDRLKEKILPGRGFEEIMRDALALGAWPEAEGREEAWLAERLAFHRNPHGRRVQRMANGRWVRVEETRTPDGGHITVGVDITDETEAEARAARAERRFRDAMEALPDGFIIWDADDRLAYCNDRCRALYPESAPAMVEGARYEDMLRYGVAQGQHPDAAGREEAWIAERLARHAAPSAPVEQALPGDRWVRVVDRRTAGGETVGVRIDVTDLKRQQRALEAARAEAETALAERSRRAVEAMTLSRIMAAALAPDPEGDILGVALRALMAETAPWLRLAPRGAARLEDGAGGEGAVAAAVGVTDAEARALCALAAAPDARAATWFAPARRAGPAAPDGAYCAPIMDGGRRIGALILAVRPGVAPEAQARAFLDDIAGALALALTRRRAQEAAEAARARAEAALAETETYRDALETHTILAVSDASRRIVSVNDRFCALTGYAREELIGAPWSKLELGGGNATALAELYATLDAGRSWRGELAYRRRDGGVVWLDSTVMPMLDRHGGLARTVSLSFDVTDRRRISDALEQANRRLELIAEMSDVGGWEFDPRTRALEWDRVTRRIHGVSEDHAPDPDRIGDFFPPEAAELLARRIRDCAETGAPVSLELPAFTAQGRPQWLRGIARPTGDGPPYRVLGAFQDVTERREREEENRRLRERFETILDNTHILIQLRDRNGVIHAANAAFWRGVGLDPNGTATLGDILEPAEAARITAGDAAIFETGRPAVNETTLRHRSGVDRTYLSSKFLIPDPETGETLLCVMSSDITEQRRREAEAARARDRFQRIFENTATPMFIKRGDGVFVMANRPYLEGVGRDSVEGLTDHDLYPPEIADGYAATDGRVFATGEPFNGEETGVVGGEKRHYLVSKFLIPDPDTGEPALCAVATDITEMKRRAIEIANMRARFEAVFENTDALMFIKRRNGDYIAANRRFLDETQQSAVLGKRDHDFFDADLAAHFMAREEQIFETGRPFFGEERGARADGEERFYLVSKFLIPDAALGEEVMCGIATDVTEMKRLQRSLEISRREAEAASVAKTEFLATMSHEIRTPMNGVIGMADLLRRTALDAEQARMLDIIRESGEGLLHIINDILDFSKIEEGRMDIDSIAFSLADIADQIERAHAARARESGVALSVACAPECSAPRLGDPHRIAQILHNLVSNAIKFSEGGSVSVRIAEGPGEAVRLTVADTGIGMSRAQAARVFERFAQADSSTTRRFGGTGLGLAIVKGLAERMGGSVTLETALGAGSTFTVTLPLRAADAGAGAGGGAEEGDAPRLRVLAADDNEINRQVLAAFLDSLALPYRMATGGPEAVAAAREGGYDVLMLDISMPEIDGVEALAAIRAEAAARGAPRAPAVAVTANAMPHQVEAYLAAGFDDHLAKPITRDALAGALRRVAGLFAEQR
jgi:PAS domain S-box-containing protein